MKAMKEAFDVEQTARMTRALLLAWTQLDAAGIPEGSEAAAKAALAKAIVEATERGENDEQKLVAHAIAHYRLLQDNTGARVALRPALALKDGPAK